MSKDIVFPYFFSIYYSESSFLKGAMLPNAGLNTLVALNVLVTPFQNVLSPIATLPQFLHCRATVSNEKGVH